MIIWRFPFATPERIWVGIRSFTEAQNIEQRALSSLVGVNRKVGMVELLPEEKNDEENHATIDSHPPIRELVTDALTTRPDTDTRFNRFTSPGEMDPSPKEFHTRLTLEKPRA